MTRKYTKKNVRKKYGDNNFKLAIKAIANGCSIREASRTFNIPYTTLNSHANHIVLYDNIGRPSKFSKEEEYNLEQAALTLQVRIFLEIFANFSVFFLIKSWGVPVTIGEFINLAKEYAFRLNKNELFPSETPTYDWLRSFLRRHENLVLKKSIPLEKKRAQVTSKEIDDWFNLLSKIIKENNLENRPGQLFNCDESGKTITIFFLFDIITVSILL